MSNFLYCNMHFDSEASFLFCFVPEKQEPNIVHIHCGLINLAL